MKQQFILITVFLTVLGMNGQSKLEKDKAAIKKMCGCFEVTFNFAETFNYANDSTYTPSKTKISKGLEWAEVIEEDSDKIVIQHLLIVGPPQKQSIIKHWRQDWLYQNTDFYTYNGDNQWKYTTKPKSEVKKQWTQKVYQVDDSPRYEATATWLHVDGKSYWESNADAPLPRREYTVRKDYNILERGNRHKITNFGWIHEQDNHKTLRIKGKQDQRIASEKGINTYKKVADEKCLTAQKWWTENKNDWKLVRKKWDALFAKKSDLNLKDEVDNKALFSIMFEKGFEFNEANIEKTINEFLSK